MSIVNFIKGAGKKKSEEAPPLDPEVERLRAEAEKHGQEAAQYRDQAAQLRKQADQLRAQEAARQEAARQEAARRQLADAAEAKAFQADREEIEEEWLDGDAIELVSAAVALEAEDEAQLKQALSLLRQLALKRAESLYAGSGAEEKAALNGVKMEIVHTLYPEQGSTPSQDYLIKLRTLRSRLKAWVDSCHRDRKDSCQVNFDSALGACDESTVAGFRRCLRSAVTGYANCR